MLHMDLVSHINTQTPKSLTVNWIMNSLKKSNRQMFFSIKRHLHFIGHQTCWNIYKFQNFVWRLDKLVIHFLYICSTSIITMFHLPYIFIICQYIKSQNPYSNTRGEMEEHKFKKPYQIMIRYKTKNKLTERII